MPGGSLALKLQNWRRMIDQTRPLLSEIAVLAAHHAVLETAIAEVQELDDKAVHLRGQRKELNRMRREAEARAGEARARVAGTLVQHFGPKSERLVGYGVGPRPREVQRQSKAEKELEAMKAQAAAGEPSAPHETQKQ
jgi:hypothetical protein